MDIGEWVTLDRELHPFEALELATVIEAVKLHVLHGWPRWWAWTFASLVAQIAVGILEAAAGELVIVDHVDHGSEKRATGSPGVCSSSCGRAAGP